MANKGSNTQGSEEYSLSKQISQITKEGEEKIKDLQEFCNLKTKQVQEDITKKILGIINKAIENPTILSEQDQEIALKEFEKTKYLNFLKAFDNDPSKLSDKAQCILVKNGDLEVKKAFLEFTKKHSISFSTDVSNSFSFIDDNKEIEFGKQLFDFFSKTLSKHITDEDKVYYINHFFFDNYTEQIVNFCINEKFILTQAQLEYLTMHAYSKSPKLEYGKQIIRLMTEQGIHPNHDIIENISKLFSSDDKENILLIKLCIDNAQHFSLYVNTICNLQYRILHTRNISFAKELVSLIKEHPNNYLLRQLKRALRKNQNLYIKNLYKQHFGLLNLIKNKFSS